MADPRDYQIADPRGYRVIDPRDYQISDPRVYQGVDPRSYQMGAPKGSPVLHARVASNEYERACFMAEQLSHNPPTLYYEDHVYYKVQVQEGRLWMKMFGSCVKSLNRKEMNVQGVNYSGVVRRLISRGTNESLNFTINESQKSSQLHSMLLNSVGVLRRVERDRKMYMADRANIIIDTVKDIGHFVEITVVRLPGHTIDEGKSVGTFILKSLGVKDEHRISPFCEYVDLEPWPVHKGRQGDRPRSTWN